MSLLPITHYRVGHLLFDLPKMASADRYRAFHAADITSCAQAYATDGFVVHMISFFLMLQILTRFV